MEEGASIRIIQKLQTGMIVGVQGERFALGNEIADRIQV
ncbi:MAG: ferrous iron transport protein A [Lachnobacterium sp.]|nr:ferrous iron transport protein A [Lachnobacterium sp.]